ncbi:MAG: preprotein translocase subunit SecE [Candidatus Pacebacteria bacterium]|nr:preprotein translocase subunit SecE [Candidatus Paceibacterota bacterium]
MGRISNFFKEVATEGKKVDWPSREQTINYTILVIGISLGVALLLGLLDAIFFRILIR